MGPEPARLRYRPGVRLPALALLGLTASGCEPSPELPPLGASEERPEAPPGEAATGRAPEDCPRGRWCYVRGRPVGVLADSTASRAFAVGAQGLVLEWAGDGWRRLPGLPFEDEPRVVAVAEGGTVFALGSDLRRLADDAWVRAPVPAEGGKLVRILRGPDDALWGATAAAPDRLLRLVDQAWTPAPVTAATDSCLGFAYLAVEGVLWSAGVRCGSAGGGEGIVVRRWAEGRWIPVGEALPFDASIPTLLVRRGRVRVRTRYADHEWDGETWTEVEAIVHGENISRCRTWAQLDDGTTLCAGLRQAFVRSGEAWLPTLQDRLDAAPPLSDWGRYPPYFWRRDGSAVHRTRSGVFYRYQPPERLERRDGDTWVGLRDDVVAMTVAGEDVWISDGELVEPIRGAGSESMATGDDVWAIAALGEGKLAVFLTDGLDRFDGERRPWLRDERGWRPRELVHRAPEDVFVLLREPGRSNATAVVRWVDGGWAPVEGGERAWTLAQDPEGRAWMATNEGVYPIEGGASPLPPVPAVGFTRVAFTEDAAWAYTHSLETILVYRFRSR